MNRTIAKVYVETAVYHIDRPFDYILPPSLEPNAKRGCRALVPFGRANKKVQGIIYDIVTDNSEIGQLKSVSALIDDIPAISEEFFEIIEFMVKTTFCTYYEAVKCILPLGKNISVVQTYVTKSNLGEGYSELTRPEQRVADFLKIPRSAKELSAFLGCKQNPERQASVKRLLACGAVERIDKQVKRVKDKSIKMVRLAEGASVKEPTPKQRAVLAIIEKTQVAVPKELAYLAGVTTAVVSALVKAGTLEYFERGVKSYSPSTEIGGGLDDITLSDEQQTAFDGINALTNEPSASAALLYGITGSGKTQVYIKLIESVVNRGKTAIMLVPEISLTPQLVQKFKALFGGIVAVIHSGLSELERVSEYERIKASEAQIVIGTRSAVFAPLENIGLIIMDEEGEGSYKSDASPRYHARDIAKLRCRQNNAVLLLSSATPSIESYYNAQKGRYKQFSLNNRYAAAELPSVFVVDMMEQLKSGNGSPLSDILIEQLDINLKKGEQSLLLLNRRGHSTVAACMDCGNVIKCPSCDVALTYHRANGCLMCHYCGHTEKFVSKCPDCGSKYIKLTGSGTQKLEDVIAERLPQARLIRMDADTTYGRESYEKAFSEFKDGNYDIMLGTQMIAKGLDFPNVTLVGVLNAESGLYSTDFRASERVFSLITQVVGRSGRGAKGGRAYVQTFDVNNQVVNLAANQDYNAFYEDEIFLRREMLLPPFCDIVTLGFSSENEESAENAAYRAIEILKRLVGNADGIALKVLGAVKAAVYKVSNKYRYRVIIKCKFNAAMQNVIAEALRVCGADKAFSDVSCYADVNG